MKFKQSVLAASITAAFAIGVVGEAAATIYAGSRLDINELDVGITGNPLPTRFDFRLTNTADLDGPAITTANCSNSGGCGGPGAPLVLNAAPANAPVGDVVRLDNVMNFFGPGGNYANSDSVIRDAELVGDTRTDTDNVAEASLDTKLAGGANAEIQSNTGFNFTFTIAAPGALTLSFMADPDMRALVSALDSGLALSNLNTSFTLRQDSGGSGLVNWNPQGTAANDCVASGGPTCVETADTQDLNINVSSTTSGVDNRHSFAAGDLGFGDMLTAFGISITGLTAGDWNLSLNEQKSVSVTNQVPEPGILALVGIGLMGLGMSSLRKKRV